MANHPIDREQVNPMKKTFCAAALLSMMSLPVMADSADITVTGTIKSKACELKGPTASELDYGVITPEDLDDTGYTLLQPRNFDLTVTCQAPVKIALSVVSAQRGSMAGATENAFGVGKVPREMFGNPATSVSGVGLGLSGGKKVGGFGMLLLQSTVADGERVDVIEQLEGGTTWRKSYQGSVFDHRGKRLISVAETNTLTPVAITKLTGRAVIEAYINKKDELNTAEEIKLSGISTVELSYL